MNVVVYGLGYVGAVTAVALATRGHRVLGIDTNETKVELIRSGSPPVSEPGLAEAMRTVLADERFTVARELPAEHDADVSLVCVGTPSRPSGGLDYSALERVATTIGASLPGRSGRHTVVVRSTVIPGTTEDLVVPALERASGGRAGADFGIAFNPEFLREGSALADFADPPKTVIGAPDDATADVAAALYAGLEAPLFRTPIRVAEMAKFVDNAFHALKIGFANEVGVLARAFGLDSHEVMEIFKADRKLNISTAYLTPGFAFGGSCLPKDLRALVHAGRHRDTRLPLLESILPSNEAHLERVADTVLALGRRRIGLIGLAFKPGTDDLRESPLVELAERLLGKGLELRIYDRHVHVSQLLGANRDYVEHHLPHLSALLVERPEDVFAHAEVCVIGAPLPAAVAALAGADGRIVVDLVRLPDARARRGEAAYVGVAW